MGLEKHPVLVLVSKKLSGLGLEACGLDYNTASQSPSITVEFSVQHNLKITSVKQINNLISNPSDGKQSHNLSVNIAADEASVSSPNPNAHTDNGVTTVRSTPNSHYGFDVGVVRTEFPSTL